MAKILVTGGLGYIGSHTIVELQASGYDVIAIDNLSNSNESILDNIEQISGKKPMFIKGDILDPGILNELFSSQRIDAVIHFAAYKAVGESVRQPLKYYKNNVSGMVNLLETMKKYGVGKIIFSSSCTVYGEPDSNPVDESAPIKNANSPYGNTKQICEEILKDDIFFKVVTLRYFNPVGAHKSGLLGELPIGVPNNLVPFITQTAAGLRDKITVFGKDYDTPDGTCIRDYLHVTDLAIAHVIAVEKILASNADEVFEVYNLGTGIGYSVQEAIQAFERINNVKLNYEFGDRREGDVEQVWADPSKANKELGWNAKISLDDMMSTAWQWQLYLKEHVPGDPGQNQN